MTKAETDFRALCEDRGLSIVGEYTKATVPIEIIANCGHVVSRKPYSLKNRLKNADAKVMCKKCQYDTNKTKRSLNSKNVLSVLSKNTFKVLSTEYENIDSKIDFKCDCGCKFTRSFYQARKSIDKYGRNLCAECMRNNSNKKLKKDYEKIKTFFFVNNSELLSKEEDYKNNKSELSYIGSCGHKASRTWNDLTKSFGLYGKILCDACGRAENRSHINVSSGEIEMREYVESLGFSILANSTPEWMQGKELDIIVKDSNIAIEYNGEYWHSEQAGKGKDYHSNKNLLAESNGVNLLQFFESEWIHKKDIVKSMIASRLGKSKVLYARKTTVKDITAKEAKEFFDCNHIHGGGGCTNDSIGLFDGDTLVCVASFKKARFAKDVEYELYRFATVKFHNVVGGFSRLMKHFRLNHPYSAVGTYMDRRFSMLEDNAYIKCGFSFVSNTKPGYYYYKHGGLLENRISYQKHKLKDKLSNFNPDKTECENMLANGYNRIWDCGNSYFTMDAMVSKT